MEGYPFRMLNSLSVVRSNNPRFLDNLCIALLRSGEVVPSRIIFQNNKLLKNWVPYKIPLLLVSWVLFSLPGHATSLEILFHEKTTLKITKSPFPRSIFDIFSAFNVLFFSKSSLWYQIQGHHWELLYSRKDY